MPPAPDLIPAVRILGLVTILVCGSACGQWLYAFAKSLYVLANNCGLPDTGHDRRRPPTSLRGLTNLAEPLPTNAVIEAGAPTARSFYEKVLPAGRPTVFRGLVKDWPVVHAGRRSAAELAAYLRAFDRGQPVGAMLGPPRIKGRFFYNDDITGFNFKRESVKLSGALDYILSMADEDRPTSFAVQSVPSRQNLPGFDVANAMKLLDPAIEPRLWIGNAVTVAAHQDTNENIACVVMGRRRFTIFPPDQDRNLYLGPFELTPAGTRISMVDFDAPDMDRFPGFAEALERAIVVDMEPGDALYIPYMWWHHVRSFDTLNMLVNYWWTPSEHRFGRPSEAFLHAMLAIRGLPEAHRDAWRVLFENYVFQTGGPAAEHLPPERRGMLDSMDEKSAAELRATLARSLSQS